VDDPLTGDEKGVCSAYTLYRTDQGDSIIALGHGGWLALTYPVAPQTSVDMLHHIVDETPEHSDGGNLHRRPAHGRQGTRKPDLHDNPGCLPRSPNATGESRDRSIWISGLKHWN